MADDSTALESLPMNNVERVSGKPMWRVPVPELRPTGWAVQYVSGMEGENVKSGYWLSGWRFSPSSQIVNFNFEPVLVSCFDTEIEANQVSYALRESCEIETKILRIP